jgi:GDPmannose 4,6-dehydratase
MKFMGLSGVLPLSSRRQGCGESDIFWIASGESRSVRDFLEAAFRYLDLDYNEYLVMDKDLYRPSEVNILQGDASKARKKLGWSPTVSFEELVKEMMDSDLRWYSDHNLI